MDDRDEIMQHHAAGVPRVAGFFPGLGSRSAYQNLDRFLLDSGIPEVVES